ncbi:MAG: hypothetical protein HYV63_25910 [Candidatus Schekmanbacteria bacterium]|nr:hypothetical protein [Candidatus Schekmanbacteria bacterium]
MILSIERAVADDPDSHRWLDRLLAKFEDGWHVWELTGLEDFESSSWIRESGARGARIREFIAHAVKRSAYPFAVHGRRIHVSLELQGSAGLSPESAVRVAEEPLTILVENARSDGAFLLRLFRELDRPLEHYRRCDGKPLRIVGCGGAGQMDLEVMERVKSSPRPRLVVVVDSDRRRPDGPSSKTTTQISTECGRLEVPCWVLAKREAENYLPEELLRARPDAGGDQSRQVDVWSRLTDDQKDFLDMKNGLGSSVDPKDGGLFELLNDEDRRQLSTGFGDKVYRCWEVGHVGAGESLRARGRGDLETGLARIRSEV